MTNKSIIQDHVKKFAHKKSYGFIYIFFLLNQSRKPAFWETFVQVKTLQLELDLEQQTGSKLRKE